MKVVCQIGLVLGLASLVLGCGREGPARVEKRVVAVTNVVETTRVVVVTNEVTVTVTNVVVERREPVRVLSARRTAPYRVSVGKLDGATLRKIVSEAGARTVACESGAVALVEASDKAVKALRSVADVEAVSAEGKVAADVGEKVRIIPLSSIDATAVTKAVRDLGGEVVQVVAVGSPAVRAKLSYVAIRKLAERGDVRRIERDEK